MRYVKIGVPDDFDTSGEYHLVDYTQDKPGITANFWEPEYREILDHGFIGMVDFMGDDYSVTQAARVSYGTGTKRRNTDEGLIRYLMRHRHTTPFEMVVFKWHVKAPIFVFRQWHRHRTASINEYSARYSVLDSDMYMPEREQATPQSLKNKQGRVEDKDGLSVLSEEHYLGVLAALEQVYHDSYDTYKYLLGPICDSNGDPILVDGKMQYPAPPDALNTRRLWVEESAMKACRKKQEEEERSMTNEEIDEVLQEYYLNNDLAILGDLYPGLAKELARLPIPVATYSQMYWQANLHNTLHFVGLRSDPHAQWEIRQYSDAMLEMMEPYIPWTVKAFKDYYQHGVHLSRMEKELIKILLTQAVDVGWDQARVEWFLKEKGSSNREITEFFSRFSD